MASMTGCGVPRGANRPNQVPARLLRVSERAQSVRLEFAEEIAVDVPREQYARQKDNRGWQLELPSDALRLL